MQLKIMISKNKNVKKMNGRIKARGNEDRGKERNLRDSWVLHFLSTWNYEKVNTNLKEASETIDEKHMQGKN